MILDKINIPADLKQLPVEQLPQLCEELKTFVRSTTKTKEGHINASLGVTELTVALHYVLNAPHDILVFDVGHQAYVHKVLTGRKGEFHTNRKKGGISGFTKRQESLYDPFGAGHSSTSISAVSGFAEADVLKGISRNRVAVIGDGALTGGMSFEAINYIGERKLDTLIVLNDNDQSIDENHGALAQLKSYKKYFESLGVNYLGDVDGTDVIKLVEVFGDSLQQSGARCIRVVTSKKFPKERSKPLPPVGNVTFQDALGKTVLRLGRVENNLVVISPAMLSGGGFSEFLKEFPARTFDVGIAEQHAVTMAAAMAAGGAVPLVHLYSTFAQRTYDQIVHDAALQDLHMVFCLDRAGLVGEDGPTHHGAFDIGFLNTVPDVRILAPIDGGELEEMLAYAVQNKGVWFIRYPKSATIYAQSDSALFKPEPQLLKYGSEKLILSLGSVGVEVAKAVEGLPYAHYNIRQLKPWDDVWLEELASTYEVIVTVEENSPRGGLGDTVRASLSFSGLDELRVRSIALPDQFVEHGTREELLQLCGLDSDSLREAFLLA